MAFVDRHRAELLWTLVSNGDARRAAVAALRPILRGATTTNGVFGYVLRADDHDRVGGAFDAVSKSASKALAADIRRLRRTLDGRIDEPVGAIIEG